MAENGPDPAQRLIALGERRTQGLALRPLRIGAGSC